MQIVKRKQLVMSVVVVTMVVAFVFFQYVPLNRRAGNLNTANAQLIADNTAVNAKVSTLPQLYQEIEKTKRQVGNFDAKIPLGRSHGTFLQKLAEVMQQHGLTELVIQPGKETETSKLSSIPVDIRCRGTLEQIFRFFRTLESFERIVRVKEVLLTNGDKLDGILTMNAKVETFYRTQ